MTTVKIEFTFKLNTQGLDNLRQSMGGVAQSSAGEAAQKVLRTARSESRVRTGNMKAGWALRPEHNGDKGSVAVYNPVPYAVFHEFGSVRFSPKPMLAPGMKSALDGLAGIVKKYIERAAKGPYSGDQSGSVNDV